MADDLTPGTLEECEGLMEEGMLRRGEAAGPIRVYHTTEAGILFAEAGRLSRDALTVVGNSWKLFAEIRLTFGRPWLIHPRMRAALDELTDAGLLRRLDDPRGPSSWEPTEAMARFTRAMPLPELTEDDKFPMVVREAGEATSDGARRH